MPGAARATSSGGNVLDDDTTYVVPVVTHGASDGRLSVGMRVPGEGARRQQDRGRHRPAQHLDLGRDRRHVAGDSGTNRQRAHASSLSCAGGNTAVVSK